MTKHTFLPTTNVEASQKEYLIASKIILPIFMLPPIVILMKFMEILLSTKCKNSTIKI